MVKDWKRRVICGLAAAVMLALHGGEAQAANTQLPILMYHNLTVNGETNSMTITQSRFREDMQFLKEYGYTPLLSQDLIEIKENKKPMPERPVMVTFDDGYESNYTLAFPILQEKQIKATISLITSHIRNERGAGMPSSMTWSQAKELYESGIIDLGTHTNMLHNEQNNGFEIPGGPDGIQRYKDETWMEYQNRVGLDLSTSIHLIQQNIGQPVRVLYFSYPFGATDTWFGQILSDNGLLVSTTSQHKEATIQNGLYGLPRYRITMELSVSKLLQHSVCAKPSQSLLQIDGKKTVLPTYQINGNNYVKLRDIAALLNDTQVQFSVGWEDGTIILKQGMPYQQDGSELLQLPDGDRTGKSMVGPLNINGESVVLAAYNIGGNYYFKLRSLGEALDFQVDWDAVSHTLILKTE